MYVSLQTVSIFFVTKSIAPSTLKRLRPLAVLTYRRTADHTRPGKPPITKWDASMKNSLISPQEAFSIKGSSVSRKNDLCFSGSAFAGKKPTASERSPFFGTRPQCVSGCVSTRSGFRFWTALPVVCAVGFPQMIRGFLFHNHPFCYVRELCPTP